MHLNIRSLANKVSEIKILVKEHTPHIFGISECELKKINGKFDEEILKVPGYNLLFPKSWASHGFARVVVYVKKTFNKFNLMAQTDRLMDMATLRLNRPGGLMQ